MTEYAEDPKQADMKVVFNKTMTMPNITFCMGREQSWSHFEANISEPVEQWDKNIKVREQKKAKK